MTKPGWRFLIAMMWCVAATTPLHAQSPVDSLKTFSDFPSLKLDRLFAGEIFTERGALMNFPNGISGQTCFFVPASAETTAARLQTWDPSPHAELKVYGFRFLKSPADLEDFRGLSFQSGQHPVRWLMDKIVTTTDSKSELNLTRAEAQALAACTGRRADPANAATCWTKLLLDRATQFQIGRAHV